MKPFSTLCSSLLSVTFAFCGFLAAQGHVTVVHQTDRDCPTRVDPRIFFTGRFIPTGMHKRASQTVPAGFSLTKSKILFAGRGIIATAFISKYTWLGEYEGDFIPLNYTCQETDYAWTINKYRVGAELEAVHYFVDAGDERVSNWLRYINCARHSVEENVGCLQCYGRRYYMTTRDIAPGEELLVYYGAAYASRLGIVTSEYFNKDFWYDAKRNNSRDRQTGCKDRGGCT